MRTSLTLTLSQPLTYFHRNLLIEEISEGSQRSYVVKVSDFGLARKVERGKYYRKSGNHPDPLRWAAPVSLTIQHKITYKHTKLHDRKNETNKQQTKCRKDMTQYK